MVKAALVARVVLAALTEALVASVVVILVLVTSLTLFLVVVHAHKPVVGIEVVRQSLSHKRLRCIWILRMPLRVTPSAFACMAAKACQVKIPKGIEEGKKIRLAGKATNGGDLLLEVKFNTHPKYRLEGKDIYLDYPIAPWEAALGGSVTVPTLSGSIKLKIPEGAKAGSKMRLKGKGLPGSIPGDQYVVLKVVTPEAKTDEQRAFYEQMQELFAWDPRQSV